MLPDEEQKKEGVANFGKHGEAENTSIGSGSSDQGVDAEDQVEEDDILAKEDEQLRETPDEHPAQPHRPLPTHGLVEEGPGPDA